MPNTVELPWYCNLALICCSDNHNQPRQIKLHAASGASYSKQYMRDVIVCVCVCVCVCVVGVSFFKSYSSQRLHVVTPGKLFPLRFSWLKLT